MQHRWNSKIVKLFNSPVKVTGAESFLKNAGMAAACRKPALTKPEFCKLTVSFTSVFSRTARHSLHN